MTVSFWYQIVEGNKYDHGDMASKAVQKRSTENIVDLMKEIITSNKAVASSVDGLVCLHVHAVHIRTTHLVALLCVC